MPLDKGLLVLRLRKTQRNLKLWKRILINLYILGGFDAPIDMITLINACYDGKLDAYRRRSLYGTVLRVVEKLRIEGNVKRYNNPVRYKLVYSRRTANYLATIARELDFPNAKTEDFL